MTPGLRAKNLRTGWWLAGAVLTLVIYSLLVIKMRGHLSEPTNLTHLQRILRGL